MARPTVNNCALLRPRSTHFAERNDLLARNLTETIPSADRMHPTKMTTDAGDRDVKTRKNRVEITSNPNGMVLCGLELNRLTSVTILSS